MGRILVIRGGAVGDFILTLPAIRLLRENLPDNELEILGYPSIISLAETAGLATRTRSIEHGALAAFFIPGGVLDPDWMDYFGSFDLIVSYLYDPDDHFHANLRKCEPGSVLACSHRVSEPGDHAAAQLARPLEQIALFLDDPAPILTLPKSPAATIADRGASEIAIHPGSGGRKKIWPTGNWVATVRALAASRPANRLLIVTGEAEKEGGITGAITDGLSGISFEHLDSLPLPELAGRLSGCGLFLGHDSGISHLAAACGIHCLLLFGPTDPGVWAPKNSGVRILRSEGADIGTITVEEVIDGAGQSLGG